MTPAYLGSVRERGVAVALLQSVGRRYAALETLVVNIMMINESEDDAVHYRREKRVKAYFRAPDQIRIEQGGRRGNLTITDGVALQHFLSCGKERLHLTNVVHRAETIPGRFRPDYPHCGGVTFLFARIAERVLAAEILREELWKTDNSEALCQVLSVTYEPRAPQDGPAFSSPIVFWVDPRTSLIARLEIDTSRHVAEYNETVMNKLTLMYSGAVTNKAILPGTFQF